MLTLLVIRHPAEPPVRHEFGSQTDVLVGRAGTVDLALEDQPAISREHLRFVARRRHWCVVNSGLNTTALWPVDDGPAIELALSREYPIVPGMHITFSGTDLRLVVDEATIQASPGPQPTAPTSDVDRLLSRVAHLTDAERAVVQALVALDDAGTIATSAALAATTAYSVKYVDTTLSDLFLTFGISSALPSTQRRITLAELARRAGVPAAGR